MQQIELQLQNIDTALSQVSKLRAADTRLYDAVCRPSLSGRSLSAELDAAAAASEEAIGRLAAIWADVASLVDQAASQSMDIDTEQKPLAERQLQQQRKAEMLQCQGMRTRASAALNALESELVGNGYSIGRQLNRQPASAATGDSMQQDAPSDAQQLQEVIERVQAITGLTVKCSSGIPDPAALLPRAASHRVCYDDATQLVMECPDAWVARVALPGPGMAEAMHTGIVAASEEAGSPPCDAFTRSGMVVFRRLSALAVRALAFFTHRAQILGLPSPAACALEDLLLWLSTYRDLFSKKCAASGKLMAPEPGTQHFLPPLLRPFRISRVELRAYASPDQAGPPAYHMQAAPADML